MSMEMKSKDGYIEWSIPLAELSRIDYDPGNDKTEDELKEAERKACREMWIAITDFIRRFKGMNEEVSRIQACIDHIKTAIDVDPWAKILCEQIMRRAIPVKPVGDHYANRRCGVCGTRVRSGGGSSSRTRDTVCRKCFTVIDWGKTR